MILEISVISIVIIISFVLSYLAVYRGDWIQCNNCESVFYPTITKSLDKKSNTFYSDNAQGWMLKNCKKCIGYV